MPASMYFSSIPKGYASEILKLTLIEATKRSINADFNGAANILRKCFPDAFQKDPDFNEYQIIKHPDLVLAQTGNFQA